MNKIDAHQHFWQYDAIRLDWINQQMAVLKQDYLPNDLLKEMQSTGVQQCVAVQAHQSEYETHFLLDLARQYKFIAGVVGWVDLQAEDLNQRLSYFSQYPKLKGFRHVVQDELDNAFIIKESFTNGLSLLSEYDFSYDILIYPRQLPAALQLVKKFPNQKFVIDHIAKPNIKSQQTIGWSDNIKALGQHANVWCKISGLVTEADWNGWQKEDFRYYIKLVIASFEPERIMFGSDWPVCLLAASYQQVHDLLDTYITGLTPPQQEGIWSGNAAEFYRLTN